MTERLPAVPSALKRTPPGHQGGQIPKTQTLASQPKTPNHQGPLDETTRNGQKKKRKLEGVGVSKWIKARGGSAVER